MRQTLKKLLAAPALPIALCFATLAFGESNHAAWVRAALDALPRYHEDREAPDKSAQLDVIAASIAEVSRDAPRPPREWAALLLTVGYHESAFSIRIHRGQCKPHECDRGRARSAWQLHKNLFTEGVWDQLHGIEHTALQVRAASDALRRAYMTCRKSGVPWLPGTLNAYAGRRCGAEWPGLDARLATFAMLSRVSLPRPPKEDAPSTGGQDRTHAGLMPGNRLGHEAWLRISKQPPAFAHALEYGSISEFIAQRSELGGGRASPRQLVERFGERYVQAQRRELSIQ
jgi:hypothetical protein